jgi:LuxR family maltose regulon positive regulatory protein
MAPSFISAKIITPLRANLVARPHLIERLKAGSQCPVILVSAPAGYRKTTLLAALASDILQNVSWLSLDREDNDSVSFWTYFISALQTKQLKKGETSLQMLGLPQMTSIKSLIVDLINKMAGGEPPVQPYVIILDDYHFIQAPAIHEGLAFLIDHLPWHLRLIISTRADPPITLARLRARGQLSKFRAQDVRFSETEIDSFFNQVIGLRHESLLRTVTAGTWNNK